MNERSLLCAAVERIETGESIGSDSRPPLADFLDSVLSTDFQERIERIN